MINNIPHTRPRIPIYAIKRRVKGYSAKELEEQMQKLFSDVKHNGDNASKKYELTLLFERRGKDIIRNVVYKAPKFAPEFRDAPKIVLEKMLKTPKDIETVVNYFVRSLANQLKEIYKQQYRLTHPISALDDILSSAPESNTYIKKLYENMQSDQPSARDILIAQEKLNLINKCILQLPENYQDVLKLVIKNGDSAYDPSSGLKAGTWRRILHYARRDLKVLMSEADEIEKNALIKLKSER